MRHLPRLVAAAVAVLAPAAFAQPAPAPNTDWPHTGGDPGRQRHSTLDQINATNVDQLEVAWTYRTGELDENGNGRIIECTPVVVDGTMYVTTAQTRLVALDAATGEERWAYNPYDDVPRRRTASGGVNRGCAVHDPTGDPADRRVLFATGDGWLISLIATTGEPDPAFGTDAEHPGRVDFKAHVAEPYAEHAGNIDNIPYGYTSPPALCAGVVIVGSSNGEGPQRSLPGDLQAFHIDTGEPAWRFHTMPRPEEPNGDPTTWPGEPRVLRGGLNAWGGFSVDTERQLVFAGLGSSAWDFFGGDRHGDNLYANCVVALDANTGDYRWHFQTVRHDLWDLDVPGPPALVTVTHDGEQIDAVAQASKTGYVYLLHRETGEPLFDVIDEPVPPTDVPGEWTAPSQPMPVAPPPLVRMTLTDGDLPDRSPEVRAWAVEQFATLRHRRWDPPSAEGTIVWPGLHGGATWSGASVDPDTGLLYCNANNIPWTITVTPGDNPDRPGVQVRRFTAPDGLPGVRPPWNNLVAVDLNTGTIRWERPFGAYPQMVAAGRPHTGCESFGGTIVTAGGLVFIGGSTDEAFHAFDKATGELLWTDQLPAGGYATPCTYAVNDRQYVVIAASGAGKVRTPASDHFVAYALPEQPPAP